ncbi:hypothetical protein G6F65_020664 [Rhizopus arrhizus]|nr:hypothetical protein G6F65_020664 [Rhizopus arrhizus]
MRCPPIRFLKTSTSRIARPPTTGRTPGQWDTASTLMRRRSTRPPQALKTKKRPPTPRPIPATIPCRRPAPAKARTWANGPAHPYRCASACRSILATITWSPVMGCWRNSSSMPWMTTAICAFPWAAFAVRTGPNSVRRPMRGNGPPRCAWCSNWMRPGWAHETSRNA